MEKHSRSRPDETKYIDDDDEHDDYEDERGMNWVTQMKGKER